MASCSHQMMSQLGSLCAQATSPEVLVTQNAMYRYGVDMFTVSSLLAHVAVAPFRFFCCQMNTCEQDPLCSWLTSAGMKHYGSGGTMSSGPSSFEIRIDRLRTSLLEPLCR